MIYNKSTRRLRAQDAVTRPAWENFAQKTMVRSRETTKHARSGTGILGDMSELL